MLKLFSQIIRRTPGAARACAAEPLESRTLLTVPAGFTETRVATGLDQPVAMEFAPDGRLFVTEKTGAVRVIDASGQLLSQPFLRLTVEDQGERGALGITFDPDFVHNRFLYIYYTATTPTVHNRLSRFTADATNPNVVEPGSEQVLMDFDTLSAIYHNSGNLHFGPDGKLYVAVGENVRGVVAQSLNNLWGKIIRINADGTIPPDNPFYNQTSGNNRAIWSYGLRNPFTFAFQPGTGRMFINDVGDSSFEEVDEGRAGGNYGWPESEGPTSDPRFDAPIYAYAHEGVCNAVTGALFYDPPASLAQFPPQYVGKYFFGDLCGGMSGGTNGGWIHVMDPTTHAVSEFGTNIQRPVDFDIGPDGSLYYLSNSRPQAVGHVYKVTYTASNAPSISVQPEDVTAPVGRPATFAVEASGPSLSYQWQRDGQAIPGANSATYAIPAAALADSGAKFRVLVSNAFGSALSDEATLTVVNNQPPVPTITLPQGGALFSGGETIQFAGVASDAEDGVLDPPAFTWRVDYVTAGVERPAVPQMSGTRGGSFTAATQTPFTGTDVVYRIFLTVTDSAGLSTTTSRDVGPRVGTIAFDTSPADRGLRLTLDGQPIRGSASAQGVVGVDRVLVAEPTQSVNGVDYVFESWSDDVTDSTRSVTTSANPMVLTARYRPVNDGSQNPASSPDLVAALATQPPAQLVAGGAKGKVKVRLTNRGPSPAAGAVAVALALSPDEFLDREDPVVATVVKSIRLGTGKSKTVTVPYALNATVPAGTYRLLARADAGGAVAERDETNNVAASAAPVTVAMPSVDLAGTAGPTRVRHAGIGHVETTLTLRNDGNVPVSSPVTFTVFASTDDVLDSDDVQMAMVTRPLKLGAGKSRRLTLRRIVPSLSPGTYHMFVQVDSNDAIAESNEDNNILAGAGTFAIQ